MYRLWLNLNVLLGIAVKMTKCIKDINRDLLNYGDGEVNCSRAQFPLQRIRRYPREIKCRSTTLVELKRYPDVNSVERQKVPETKWTKEWKGLEGMQCML